MKQKNTKTNIINDIKYMTYKLNIDCHKDLYVQYGTI